MRLFFARCLFICCFSFGVGLLFIKRFGPKGFLSLFPDKKIKAQKWAQNEVWVLENQHRHGVLRWNRAWCLRSAMVIACRQSSSNSIKPNPKRNQQDFSVCRRETLQAEDHDFNLGWDDDNIHQRRPTRAEIPQPLVWFSIFGERDRGRSWLLAAWCERLGGSAQCERGCKQRLHVVF